MNKDNIATLAIWSGVASGTLVVHFSPAFGLFDLVAKAQVLNMNQFNGVSNGLKDLVLSINCR